MNSIQIFSGSAFSVRTIEEGGQIWFVGKDILEALEYEIDGGSGKYFAHVPDCWKGGKQISTRSENGVIQKREVLCLTEQGVYFFLGRSDKPKALPYQLWLANYVVPSIRKTGSYSISSLNTTHEALNIERAKMLQHMIDAPSFAMTEETKAVFAHEVFKLITGREYLGMLPATNDEWFSAADIGSQVGLSANMVGRIAKKYSLKAPQGESNQYGRWIFSKSRYSDKEVPQFIYNTDALDWFKDFTSK